MTSAYRCETCAYFKLHEPERSEFADCTRPMNKHDIFMTEIHGFEYDRIEKMGCCSHSQHQSAEQRIEDVMKELEWRIEQSKKLQSGFTENEAARVDGIESGYENAIALLREGE